MIAASGIIGNYTVERELGRGGMGVVFAATHRVLGRPAAIKLLLADTIQHRDRVERFFNEARAAMAIDHPGVVKIYDVGIAADGRAYIAMELLAGSPLSSYLVRGPLPVRIALDYSRQIAGALAAAHAAGIIHRDLKPGNVIVTERGLKLVDFGIAKLADPVGVRTATGALLGTPQYMSPEQCEGLREIDARSDLYSLGCVMFHMLGGRPPFDAGGQGGVITAHLTTPPPLVRTTCPAASPALESVVQRLLAKPREQRFASARTVIAALADPAIDALLGPPGAAPTADVPDRAPLRGPATAPATGMGMGSSAPMTPSPMIDPRPPTVAAAPSIVTPQPRRRAGIILSILACIATAVIVILIMKCSGAPDRPVTAATIDASPVAVATVDAAIATSVSSDAALALLPRPDAGRAGTGRTKPDARVAVAVDPPRPDAAVVTVVATPPDAAVVRPQVDIDVTIAFGHQSFSFSGDPAALDRVAAAMNADPRLRLVITGFADSTEGGRSPDNLALARANAIKQQLVSRRVDRDRIKLSSRVVDADGSAQRARIETN